MTNNAYNIRTSTQYYQKKLKDYYDIRLSKEDEAFYCDNCCDAYMCHMFTYLIFKIYAEVLLETVNWQLGEMEFVSSVINLGSILDTNLNPKFEYAPLTNIGCESQLSKLDNHINITGGTTSIKTISKNIHSNKCLFIRFRPLRFYHGEKKEVYRNWLDTLM